MTSIRAERRSPPCAAASQAPVLRHALTSSIAVDGATPLAHALCLADVTNSDAHHIKYR
jgi:hypothetical protein